MGLNERNLVADLPQDIKDRLLVAIDDKKSILVGGKTGSGKSQVTVRLGDLVPESKTVVRMEEDTSRLVEKVEKGSLLDSFTHPVDVVVLDELRGEQALTVYNWLIAEEPVSVIANIYAGSLEQTVANFIKRVGDADVPPLAIHEVLGNVYTQVDYVVYVERLSSEKDEQAQFISRIGAVQDEGSIEIIY